MEMDVLNHRLEVVEEDVKILYKMPNTVALVVPLFPFTIKFL